MAHFAQLNENNIVQKVIIVDNEHSRTEEEGISYIKNVLGYDGVWLQTSYNNTIRGKFAGKMDIYDPEQDEFLLNMEYLEQQEKAILEQQEKSQTELAKKEAIAAKIGLTVEELKTILNP